MVATLGYDIGGANTKAAYIQTKNGKLQEITVASEYFPIWKAPRLLPKIIRQMKRQLGARRLEGVGVTMTAELSDAFQTKREGVGHVLNCLQQVFPRTTVFVLTNEVRLDTLAQAKTHPLSVAAANWAATGWLVAKHFPNCVVIDVGSTSTSIIPVVKGRVVAKGKTDLEKLLCGELVYTGSLRTNVAAIVQSIPIKGGVAGVSSELFATSGDVHFVLGNISEADFSSETADGRGKTAAEASARLARVVCADTEMLTQKEIVQIASYIAEKQLHQVTTSLSNVYAYTKTLAQCKVPVVVTGLGKDFIARKAAEAYKVDEIVDLGKLLPPNAVFASPAFGVALMTAEKIERGKSK